MRIHSFLIQGAGSALAARLGSPVTSEPLDALVLMSLGVEQSTIVNALRQHQDKIRNCPVYFTETYGILGFDDESNQNVELMEKGRGSEYGFAGGSGGLGCLVLGYSKGAVAGHSADFTKNDNIASLMVIADQSSSWDKVQSQAPIHFGGITKQCWKVHMGEGSDNISLEPVPYFWVAETSGAMTGIKTFTGEAAEATQSLLESLPTGWKLTGDIGLFPCFTRGVNQYGKENIETQAIGTVLKPLPLRVYGMFAHGELGPCTFSGFTNEAGNKISCEQHSGSSILSIHTAKTDGKDNPEL